MPQHLSTLGGKVQRALRWVRRVFVEGAIADYVVDGPGSVPQPPATRRTDVLSPPAFGGPTLSRREGRFNAVP